MTPFLIGLSGLSGSGKSTLADRLEAELGIARFRLDSFYKDETDCPRNGPWLDWECAESMRLDEAVSALKNLKEGKEVSMPLYSRRDSRRSGFAPFKPAPVILAEGHLLFADTALRSVFDLRLWIQVPEEIALARRLKRQPDYDLAYHREVVLPSQKRVLDTCRTEDQTVIDGMRRGDEVFFEARRHIREKWETFLKENQKNPA